MRMKRIGCKLRFGRMAFRGLAWFAAGMIAAVLIGAGAASVGAQSAVPAQAAAQSPAPVSPAAPAQTTAPATAPPASPTDLAGIWQGTLMPPNAPKGVRFVVKVTKGADGSYKAALYNADQGQPPLTFSTVTLQGADVKLGNSMLSISGKMSADGKTIDGNFNGGGPNPLPLALARTDPDAAWPIPEPIKAMAADANPGFDVVTVKPSKPGQQGKLFTLRGTHFVTLNTNLNDLLALAYGVHAKQIIGAPDWAGSDLFDIDGVPDVPGRPNLKQMGLLTQKLLADRFSLKIHHETRELSVYTITVAGGSPKMEKTTASPGDPPGFLFRGLGDLIVRNMTLKDFADGMQSAVTDRPVVDQTGLTDRYDFNLKWTPDDSQFAQFRGTNTPMQPPAGDNPNAPPSLYTAVQEQLGLKFTATKAPDDVIVIDHVEKPSAN
jgi:uncharacterized protein (TIGR03435 family)